MTTPLTWGINAGQSKEPPQAKKNQGWNPEEPAAAEFLNWWMGHVDEYMARVALAFAPHQETVPVMTVRLEAGAIWDGGDLTEVAAQSTTTIVVPTVDPRIDRVVIDRVTGAVSVITGTEAASPVAPDFTQGKAPICQVSLVLLQTTIVNDDITDERAVLLPNRKRVTITGSGTTYTIGTETYLIVDRTVDVTVTLPDAAGNDGAKLYIKNIMSANTVTLDGLAGDTIDGELTLILGSQYQSATIVSDGTNWFII